MSIRQMLFEEGQELNIRECPKLQPRDTTVEALQKLMDDETVKIVKSGKSYYDVSSKPEIFDAARDDFSLESLTKVDQRDLRHSEMKPAFQDENTSNPDPMAALFQKTESDEEEPAEEYERKTYYLRLDQIEALKALRFKEDRDVSAIVRELFDIAIAQKSLEHNFDFRADAEQRLLANPRKPKKRSKKRNG